MEKHEFVWIFPSGGILQRETSIQGKFYIAKLEHFSFQRDKNAEDGQEVYLYHNKEYTKWYLAYGSRFRDEDAGGWMSLYSSGQK